MVALSTNAGLDIPGKTPTIVLLHGAGGNHRVFEGLASQFGEHRVLAPSLPGRCGSDEEPLMDVSEMASWLANTLAAASPGPMLVCGHSLGGACAIELALQARKGQHSLECVGLVLMATGASLRVAPHVFEMMKEIASRDNEETFSSRVFQPDSDRRFLEAYEASIALTPAITSTSDWCAADGFDRKSEIGELDLPTLVLAGDEDQLAPAKYSDFLCEQMPKARLDMLNRAGHMFPFEQSVEVGERIMRFAKELLG